MIINRIEPTNYRIKLYAFQMAWKDVELFINFAVMEYKAKDLNTQVKSKIDLFKVIFF